MKLLFTSKMAIMIAFCLIVILPTSCQQADLSFPQPVCSSSTPINPAHSNTVNLRKILNQYATEGMPGIALAIFTPEEGFWEGTSGYARIEDGTSMQPCHLQYIQSITKMYMAVGILKLHEQGKIDLDKPITTYLPEKIIGYIHSADRITVRMLLNHTSGIPEYSDNPEYISYLLQHPLHVFSSEDYLGYIDGKK